MKPRFVIVGLGNPGANYESTRHNVGFLALDHIAKEFKAEQFKDNQKFLAQTTDVVIDGVATMLVKPTTYMNRSAESIRKILTFFKLPATRLLVISDDIDLPPGTFRMKLNGGPGTHNGLKSIVEDLGEDFPRLRIGIGTQPEGHDLAAWVLSTLSREELSTLRTTFNHLPELISTRIDNLKAKPS